MRSAAHDGTLVLGAAVGFQRHHILPFLSSLAATDFHGHTVLFADLLETELYRALESWGVRLIGAKTGSFPETAWANNTRYFVYNAFLEVAGGEYDRVMLTDVRDVIFQRNPFTIDTGECLGCFEEDRRRSIGNCAINSGWIRAAFGEAALQEIAEKPIVCSGTTLGPAGEIRGYLNRMTAHLGRLDLDNRGIDQGVHNYMIHVEGFDRIRIFPNGTGPVLTMGHMDGRFLAGPDGTIRNPDDEPYHVLHQYDRFPDIRGLCVQRLRALSGLPEEDLH
jgi:hypothetical protein